MKRIQQICLIAALSAASMSASAQSFEQRGPTGDNRAATGNAGTQASPKQSGQEAAKQKTPLRQVPATPTSAASGHQNSAAPTASPGTPAENHAQPEGAK